MHNLKKFSLGICIFSISTLSFPCISLATNKIWNGIPVDQRRIPVAFLINQNGSSCSGSVISNKGILTAGHCIDTWSSQNTPVLALVKGKLFYAVVLYRGPNDLGAIKVNKKLPSGSYPIKKNLKLPIGYTITVLGFGYPNNGVLHATNQSVNLHISTEQFLVGQGEVSSACVGDSGGPAIGIYKRKTYIFGVVSKGLADTCAPTIFESTTSPVNYKWFSRIKTKTK